MILVGAWRGRDNPDETGTHWPGAKAGSAWVNGIGSGTSKVGKRTIRRTKWLSRVTADPDLAT